MTQSWKKHRDAKYRTQAHQIRRDDSRTRERVYCNRSRKISFLTKREAEAEAARQSVKHPAKAAHRVYLCRFCWDWHITTKPQRGPGR